LRFRQQPVALVIAHGIDADLGLSGQLTDLHLSLPTRARDSLNP
jgi:hypothetical protein